MTRQTRHFDNDDCIFYRVGNVTENPLETNSADDLNDIDLFDDFEMAADAVADYANQTGLPVYFDADGHLGAGIYYEGVCATESLENMKAYTARISENECCFILRGELLGNLMADDGVLIAPETVIEIINADEYNRM